MKKKAVTTHNYVTRIREILQSARYQSLRAVNSAMVVSYWYVGREIVSEEQRGQKRAEYGKKVLQELAASLVEEFGKGFSIGNLRNMRQFYLTYSDSEPTIHYTPSSALPLKVEQVPNKTKQTKIHQTVSSESRQLNLQLSWSHYCLLMRVNRKEARQFYEGIGVGLGLEVHQIGRAHV